MEGALLVTFFCIFMPIFTIYFGLKIGNVFFTEVWESIALMFRTTAEWMLPQKPPPYEPEPILPLYEDQLESLTQTIVDERARNPRHVRDDQFRTSWNREFRRLNLPNEQVVLKARDDDDLATIRDWEGNILRQDFRTKKCDHDHTMVCYHCERKNKWQ